MYQKNPMYPQFLKNQNFHLFHYFLKNQTYLNYPMNLRFHYYLKNQNYLMYH
jgi:hypothetical protein